MTAAEIKEYLGMCVDVEKEIYTQDCVAANMKNRINQLGRKKNYAEPELKKVDGGAAGFLAVVGGGVFLISAWLMSVIGWLLGFLCGIGMVVGVVILLLSLVIVSEDAKQTKQYKEEYEKGVQQYNLALKNDEKRVANELRQKAYLQAQLNDLIVTSRQTRAVLRELYDKNIIHPNYRGLIPMCSLYSYFDTGVCTQLEGHEGAYNKYDLEKRLDRIVCQLDEVLRKLNQIKRNQEKLYEVICDANDKVDKLIDNTNHMSYQLNGIQAQGAELNARIENLQTTADLTLYASACNHQELAYLNRLTEWGY